MSFNGITPSQAAAYKKQLKETNNFSKIPENLTGMKTGELLLLVKSTGTGKSVCTGEET